MIDETIDILLADNSSNQITPERVRYICHQLLKRIRVTPFGEFQIFKANGNTQAVLEVGDVAVGFLSNGTFIPFGKYLGGDVQDVENSWDTSPMWLPEIINQT